ncbi:MAG TPA: sigma-70 family RNA polymerase sigma factor [Steroidobacteraceae bacterium]
MDAKRARFEGQVLPHLDAAYRFARWLCYSPGDADDVVQEAVLRAYRGFDALRGSDAKSWLLTIVRNCHFTAAKQTQRRAAVPLPEENGGQEYALIATAAGPEESAILSDQKKLLDKLMAALPEEQRTVLMLREIEEMDYAQIAAVTQVPIGTVMSRLARSRAALKTKWLQCAAGEPRAVR